MNKYLVKLAELNMKQKKEIFDTATIGATGALSGVLGTKMLGKNPTNWRKALVFGGIGVPMDYAAVKVNQFADKHMFSEKQK